MAVPVYKGKFTAAQAERLLWRAGFGPKPGEAAALAKRGLKAAVYSLTRPGTEQLVGPEPTDDRGFPIAPLDAVGHDHLWWLDRMVRTTTPLVERMTLNWHDWFATSNRGVGSQKLMLDQNETLRANALGSFQDLLLAVTVDPAMLHWLNGDQNTRLAPNENYGRELMELFTLGAGRPGGYSETDVREQARALTGWRSQRVQGVGPTNFQFVPALHDAGTKTIFGQSGNYDWRDSCRLVLTHPALYTGPRMVKPPTVYAAGMLRTLGRGIDTAAWAKLSVLAGQRLFYPPNVAGWDETRWLDTATFRGRWYLAATALDKGPTDAPANLTAAQLLSRALSYWGSPTLGKASHDVLLRFAQRGITRGRSRGQIETSLRQLVPTTPEYQTA